MVKTGDLLLAEPYLNDPNFKRSAIAIADHHEEGSVGFVLNQPLTYKVSDVIHDFPYFDAFMHYGGPVQRDTLHFLHRAHPLISESIHVIDDIYWGGSFEELTMRVEEGTITPKDVRFFLGYSGWSPGQLEGELKDNTWVISDMPEDLFFDTPVDQLWPKGMRRLGNSFGVISTMDEESLN